MASKRLRSSQSQVARNRQVFDSLDRAGQEVWIRLRLMDQEIRTLGEAARRDEEAFVEVVQALLRTGHEVDATVRSLAGLDRQ